MVSGADPGPVRPVEGAGEARKPSGFRSLKRRIADFFEANPDEELTPTDAVVKFGVRHEDICKRLSALVREGVLQKRRDGRFVVYEVAK